MDGGCGGEEEGHLGILFAMDYWTGFSMLGDGSASVGGWGKTARCCGNNGEQGTRDF